MNMPFGYILESVVFMNPPRQGTYVSKRTRKIRRNLMRAVILLCLGVVIVGGSLLLFLAWHRQQEPESSQAASLPTSSIALSSSASSQITSPSLSSSVVASVNASGPASEEPDIIEGSSTEPPDDDNATEEASQGEEASGASEPTPPLPTEQPLDISVPPIRIDTLDMVSDPFFSDALFIGDSITTGLDRHVQFDNHLLADVGLTLEKANNRIFDFASLHASRIYILLGINDLTYFYMTEELFCERYLQLISSLRELFPNAEIYPQSILPLAAYYQGAEGLNNERIASFNHALEMLCDQEGLLFIDIGIPWRLADNSLNPEVSSGDGLHIKFSYYGTWLLLLKEMSSQ